MQEWVREAARKSARDAPPQAPPADQAGQLTAAHYDFVFSYDELNASSEALAYALYAWILKRGGTAREVCVGKRDSVVTEAEVKNSKCVIAVVSGPQGGDDTGYFSNSSCLQVLRWATEAEVFIQPIVDCEAKHLIGRFFAAIPADLKHLKCVNWERIDRKDVDYFELGVMKVLRAAGFNLAGSVSGPGSVAPRAGIGAVIECAGGAASRLQETSSGAAPVN